MLEKYKGLINKNSNSASRDLSKPSIEVLLKTTAESKEALQKIINGKIKSSGGNSNLSTTSTSNSKYIRYTPTQTGLTNNPDGDQRIIKLTELSKDPLEPVKFKHKRIPREGREELVPILHSPPRKLTMQDQQDWKVPPCISNWKNAKGYTIPLEMRLSADGRNLRDFTVSEKFSQFADVLYVTEKQARKEIEERIQIQESIKIVDTLKKEQELKEAAKDARQKKMALAVSNISSVQTNKTDKTDDMLAHKREFIDNDIEAEKIERNNLRNVRKKELERERRTEMQGNRRNKANPRDEERDISEKIALGQAQPTMRDNMIDSRLYNQTNGLETGFKDEEDYDLFDKPLFADRTSNSIYKNVKNNSTMDDSNDVDDNQNGSRKLMEKISQRGKMFEGTDIGVKQSLGKPIEFEKTTEEYGLNSINKLNARK